MANAFPKIHNAAWPGLVGKGGDEPGAEPFIPQDEMIEMTVAAEVDGQKFDGIDLFLAAPHNDIDSPDDYWKSLTEKLQSHNLTIGSLVAPVWGGTGGGSAFGSEEDRKNFLNMVKKACLVGKKLKDLGQRKYGIIRIDTADGPEAFSKDPAGNQKKNIETFTEACKIAEDHGERLGAEAEICWGGMHGWKSMLEIFEGVNRPETLGLQADMAHTLLLMLGYNTEQDALVPEGFNWEKEAFDAGYKEMTDKLRPWLIDFHIAQNDATVKGSGDHDKTGKHCVTDDPNGKLDIPYHAGFWLKDEGGSKPKAITHMCWDGCMFPNDTMRMPETWNNILGAMLKVREQHGWN